MRRPVHVSALNATIVTLHVEHLKFVVLLQTAHMRREARITTFFIDGGSSDSTGAGLGEESIFWRFLSKKRMTVFLAVCANETTHKTHLPNAQKVRRNIPNRDKAYFDMLLASGSSMTTWSRRSRRLSLKKARFIDCDWEYGDDQ